MNYTQMLKKLLKESLRLEQYKRLSIICRAMITICMLPIIIADIVLIGQFFVIDFLLKGLSTPFQLLHLFVENERKEVRHATEAVIYAITLPFLFVYNICLAMQSFYFYLSWFCIMCLTYLWTLGGIKWQPFIMDVTFESEPDEYVYKPSLKTASAIITVTFSLLVCYLVCAILAIQCFDVFTNTNYESFLNIYKFFFTISNLVLSVYSIMLLIVTPIVFRKSKACIDKGYLDTEVENEEEWHIDTAASNDEAELSLKQQSDKDTPISIRCVKCDRLITRKTCPYCGTYNS